jgi:hydroxyacylglutathione hydrolase
LQIWPAHGAGSACGKGLGAVPSSTIGYEKLFNPALAYTDENEFVEWLLDEQPEPPRYFAVMKRVNKEGPAIVGGRSLPVHLPADRLPELVAQNAQIVDTRRTAEFAGQYLPGTINIPLSELPNWAGWLLDYERPYYLLVDSDRLPEAVRDLLYIGADNIAGYFEHAALHTLAERGVQLRTYEHATPDKLAAGILNGEYVLLDVRNQTEWEEGHIPGAQHVMLGYLAEHADEFFHGKRVVLQCRTGNRSAIGASILSALGAQEVINMQGGIRDWQAAGLPVE